MNVCAWAFSYGEPSLMKMVPTSEAAGHRFDIRLTGVSGSFEFSDLTSYVPPMSHLILEHVNVPEPASFGLRICSARRRDDTSHHPKSPGLSLPIVMLGEFTSKILGS
jgi:hypothetical protein